MAHFLVKYDRKTHQADVASLDDIKPAQAEYARLEREHMGSKRIEIVLLSAASQADLHVTHGRYFRDLAPLVD